jgi:hypothetical protein
MKNKMDIITISLAVLAALSEILPLVGFTRANGVLHGLKIAFIHFHAESDCNVDITVD